MNPETPPRVSPAPGGPHRLTGVGSARPSDGGAILSNGPLDRGFVCACACTLIMLAFMAAAEPCRHWFVVPVTLCGILVGLDALDWLLGRLDQFDPAGMLGLLGLHFFFLAPLLHVSWDWWTQEVDPPPDWRDWLGAMAALNAVGLLTYRLARSVARRGGSPASWRSRASAGGHMAGDVARPGRDPSSPATWYLDRRRFAHLAVCALLVSAVLQVWVYVKLGGLAGYVQAGVDPRNTGRMEGMGSVFMISESFPIVALMLFAVYAGERAWARSWAVLVFVLVVYFFLMLAFGGLRGSRANTLWGLFWAVGILHLWVRPVPRKALVAGLGVLAVFMYYYGFLKDAGADALAAIGNAERRSEVAAKTHRTVETLLLGDFGRTDIQAFLLYRIADGTGDYPYAFGRTYVGAVALLVPKSLWPDRPPTKVKEGTEIQFGRGWFIPRDIQSSRIYGLAGEAMLNFGPAAVPLAFAVLGLAVGWLQRLGASLRAGDVRLLWFPLLVNCTFIMLVSDSDDLLFFMFKDGAVPLALTALCVLSYRPLLRLPGRQGQERQAAAARWAGSESHL